MWWGYRLTGLWINRFMEAFGSKGFGQMFANAPKGEGACLC
jgi:hypothetical protein